MAEKRESKSSSEPSKRRPSDDPNLPVYHPPQDPMNAGMDLQDIDDMNIQQYELGEPSVDGSRPFPDRFGVRSPDLDNESAGMPGSEKAHESGFSGADPSAIDPATTVREKRYNTRGNARAQTPEDAGDLDIDPADDFAEEREQSEQREEED